MSSPPHDCLSLSLSVLGLCVLYHILCSVCVCVCVCSCHSLDYLCLVFVSFHSRIIIIINPRPRMRGEGVGVRLSVRPSVRPFVTVFLKNHGSSGLQTWICYEAGCIDGKIRLWNAEAQESS